jgi:hypothetical protein
MADIKIKRTNTVGDYTAETAVEITGADYINEELVKAILDKTGRTETPLIVNAHPGTTAEVGSERSTEQEEKREARDVQLCRFRMVESGDISPDDLKTAVEEGNVDEVVSPFDEIDIPLDTGGTVTVVCAYSSPNTARFVFKDCWDEAAMNDEATNKGGYYKSKGRAHVLVDILPHIAQEWRAIFKPRKMVEEIDGERIEYADLMWLLSATDVFGPSEEGYWKDIDDGFQLPIFKRERDRVKECGSEGTYPYWLRSVHATGSYYFCYVHTDGSAGTYGGAYWSDGFAPGFDI